jgi:hypothetical protein
MVQTERSAKLCEDVLGCQNLLKDVQSDQKLFQGVALTRWSLLNKGALVLEIHLEAGLSGYSQAPCEAHSRQSRNL